MSAPGSAEAPLALRFHFSPELRFFLRRADRGGDVVRALREKTSAKDAIEACGVPHPEVNVISCNGISVGFEHQLTSDATIEVIGVHDSPCPGLQQRTVKRFVADGHLGKLARDLRLLGFDVSYAQNATDAELVAISAEEKRALLTRDRRLLMHKVVRHGYCPRSLAPDEQSVEVVRRFALGESIHPFTRCMHCNGLLRAAEKAEVLEELEPLTRIYYDEFRRCSHCRHVYWRGSHFVKLEARVAKIRAALRAES